MWRSKTKSRSTKIDTLVGHQTVVTGDITFNGGLHVEGTIRGNVVSNADGNSVLILSENGNIEGDVSVPNLVLNGTVQGDVYASERLELIEKARIKGNVYYNLLEMAIGAEVNGNLVHRKDVNPQLEYKEIQEEEYTDTIVKEITQVGNNS